jgi:hypothetical protein
MRRIALVPLLAFAPLVVLTACMEVSTTGVRAPPPTGALEITTSTVGVNIDKDGYTCVMDFSSADPMRVNETAILTGLSVGDHSVVLAGVAENCRLSGSNPRLVNIVADRTAQITFSITCE